MRKLLHAACLILLLPVSELHAQAVDVWNTYSSYRTVRDLAADPDGGWWIATSGGVLHRTAQGTFLRYGRIDGLYDTDVLTVAVEPATRTVWFGFADGTLNRYDLDGKTWSTLTDIARNDRFATRRINRLVGRDGMVWAATDFGIVILDAQRSRVNDSYTNLGQFGSGTAVYDLDFVGNAVWAATESGLAIGDPALGDLLVSANWRNRTSADGLPDGGIRTLAWQGGLLFAATATHHATGDGTTFAVDDFWNGPVVRLQRWSDGSVTALQQSRVMRTVSGAAPTEVLTAGAGERLTAYLESAGTRIAGTFSDGLRISTPGGGTESVALTGPYYNLAARLTMGNGLLAVANSSAPGQNSIGILATGLSLYDGETWVNENARTRADFATLNLNSLFRVLWARNAFWFGAWGPGVVRYDPADGSVRRFDASAYDLPGVDGIPSYQVTIGLTEGADGRIWVAQWANRTRPLAAYDEATDTWTSYPISSAVPTGTQYHGVMADSYGQLWIPLMTPALQGRGLLVLRVAEDGTQTAYRLNREEAQGALPNEAVKALVQDRNGEIWVGTERGVVRFLFPDRIIEGTAAERRSTPLINEDPTASDRVLLRDIRVTAIAVDAANRKWIGTETDGVWLVSAEGGRVVRHFTRDNSPLPTNRIESITIHDATGEVFFGTNAGIVGYVAETRSPETTMRELDVYPNPYRYAEHDGTSMVIDGLEDESVIRVLTADGRLLRRIDAAGGRATWDGRDATGSRVATGIYMVVATNPTGGRAVGRVLVIR